MSEADARAEPSEETAGVDATGLRARVAWAAFGVATFFAFPHEVPGLDGRVLDLGLLGAWLVPAALVVATSGRPPRRAARAAFFASFATHTLFFYWFLVVTMVYAGMPVWLGILAPLVPALYVAPFTALFVWAWRRFERPGLVGVLGGAALWVAVDWARGQLFGGFPWATLGYALHADAPLLFVTRWGGVYALSFLAAAVGIALARAYCARGDVAGARGARRDLAWVVGAVVALHVVGAVVGDPNPAGGARTFRVAAIQGNVDQGEKWAAERRERILSRYLALSEQAARDGAQWIVWPETAVPGIVENDGILRDRLAALARDHAVTLVVGGMGVEIDYAARRFSAFFDSAFLFDPDGALEDRYDKTHLVPFGEYVPLRAVLGTFFQSIATGLSSSDVTPGDRPRNMALVAPGADAADPDAARLLAGVPICYELLFPDLVRRFGAEGATVLLAITNDAWYGRTGAPHQFLAMTALRAAETGLPLVRAANTGVSALVDARGVVVERSRLFEEAIVIGDIEVFEGRPPTFYARFGDVFVLLCGLGWAASAALGGVRPGAPLV